MFSSQVYAQDLTNTKPLTRKEQTICKKLDTCVDILQRHDDGGFDYDVLAQEFQRLGGPSLRYFLGRIGSDDETPAAQDMAKRAQNILSRKGWQFTPQAQAEIAKLWPRADLAAHKRIMLNIATMQMRDRAVMTLSDDSAEVALQSREFLKSLRASASGAKAFNAPLSPAVFDSLSKAAKTDPTPDIIALIGRYPAPQSSQILADSLLSKTPDIVSEVYAQLYAQNPDRALSAFKAALRKLTHPRQAFALSQLLQARHLERSADIKDGFYLHLAHGVFEDEALPPLAHMMAMDVIFNSPALDGKTLPNGARSQAIFKNLIAKSQGAFAPYADGFETKAGANTTQFLPIIWAEIMRRDGTPNLPAAQLSDAVIYVQLAQRLALLDLKTPLYGEDLRGQSAAILRQGLRFSKDWRMQKSSALALGHIRDKASQAGLFQLSQNHPILDVRAASASALAGIASGKMDISRDLQRVKANVKSCPVSAFDFAQDAKQLPFFEGAQIPQNDSGQLWPAKRRYLQVAFPAQPSKGKSGWLAAYHINPSTDGLLYYDNVSGEAELLSKGDIMAILPVRPTPLGTIASEFWIVERGADFGRIYFLKFENDKPLMWRHLELPTAPLALNIAKDQSLQMGFGEPHPPLRLLPNGQLISGCTAPRANSNAQTALPN